MKLYAILATLVLVVALALAAPAMGYGPQNSPAPRAFDACFEAIDLQQDAGIIPGGGPKTGGDAPINCDHFWQQGLQPEIGNGWPPPPFL